MMTPSDLLNLIRAGGEATSSELQRMPDKIGALDAIEAFEYDVIRSTMPLHEKIDLIESLRWHEDWLRSMYSAGL